eukprot:5768974-Prorocentrum_lima.AAC.1
MVVGCLQTTNSATGQQAVLSTYRSQPRMSGPIGDITSLLTVNRRTIASSIKEISSNGCLPLSPLTTTDNPSIMASINKAARSGDNLVGLTN